MNEYVKSDLFRYTGSTDIKSFLKLYFQNAAFRYMCAFRYVKSEKKMERFLGKILWKFRPRRLLDIPLGTTIGYGLYIGHNGPCVINSSTVIGDNVNLSQYVTIGANEGRAARIGNSVYIGPSCCIVEDVEIGDNATIGAGSVVTKSIPPNATAAGNYAKILNYKSPGRFINNKWNMD
ncbi:MAG: hypothetical protein UDM08_07130 [Eggerthellaceae bacterium]|nr:hypothetical protein [Eggerthellaceae bacterium]